MAGVAERRVGRAHASELERPELTTLPRLCGRNGGPHGLDPGGCLTLANEERAARETGPMFEERQLMLFAISNGFIGMSNGLLHRRSVGRHVHASDKRRRNGHCVRT